MTKGACSEKNGRGHASDKKEQSAWRCIPEETYAQEMRQVVEPYLSKYRRTGMLEGLYYEFYRHEKPRGTIVISFGFSESCEKYHELIYYMHREGYQAAVMDHRGHGRSKRQIADLTLVHVENFSRYVEDLHLFIRTVVLPESRGIPLYLYAHSMGGCIGTLYLEQHPKVFQKAVLSAPMYGINNGKIPDFAAGMLCRGAILLGKKKEKLFTMGGFDSEEPFEASGCDSPARHDYYLRLRREHREYQTSAATYGWANQALSAGRRAIAVPNAGKIHIPVLLFQAARDTFVRGREQDLFLSRIRDGRKITVRSRHEINRMPANKLEKYMHKIFDFYNGENF